MRREIAATISAQNGAYLVDHDHGPVSANGYHTPTDLFEAASSLRQAKALAVETARDLGYEGAPRWELGGEGYPRTVWVLTMAWCEEGES